MPDECEDVCHPGQGACCGGQPAPDPGNSGPDDWTAQYDPDSEVEQERLLRILAGEEA